MTSFTVSAEQPVAAESSDLDSRHASAPGLRLEANARIVPDGNSLHVLHRRGLSTLRGKGIVLLHQRLAPFLDGRFTRVQLLSLAGAQAGAVERYLSALCSAGALREEYCPVLAAGFPHADSESQSLTVGSATIVVSLTGLQLCATATLTLCFASRDAIERHLIGLRSPTTTERILIACDAPLSGRELSRRAAVARHLIALSLGRGLLPRTVVFELAADRLRLSQLASVESPKSPLASLPSQLRWIRPADVPQLPLVVLTGELPGLARRCVGIGLDARQVSEALTIRFLGHEALALTVDGSSHAIVAATPTECLQRLVCSHALQTQQRTARDFDLLQIAAMSDRVAMLQRTLRRHRSSLRGEFDDSGAPLMLFRNSDFSIARFGFEEMVAEALVFAVMRDLSIDERSALLCVPSFRSRRVLRQELRTVLARLAPPRPVSSGRLRRFGRSMFFAVVADNAERRP